jgi:hypothetical protein
MLRQGVSVFAGIIIAGIVISGLERVTSQIYPSAGINYQNPLEFAKYLASAPIVSLILLLVAEIAGVLLGSILASWMASSITSSLLIGLYMTLGHVYSIMEAQAHPSWYSTLYLAAAIPISFLGGSVGVKLGSAKSTGDQ